MVHREWLETLGTMVTGTPVHTGRPSVRSAAPRWDCGTRSRAITLADLGPRTDASTTVARPELARTSNPSRRNFGSIVAEERYEQTSAACPGQHTCVQRGRGPAGDHARVGLSARAGARRRLAAVSRRVRARRQAGPRSRGAARYAVSERVSRQRVRSGPRDHGRERALQHRQRQRNINVPTLPLPC